MSVTPDAQLARLKVAFPARTIQAVEPGKGTGRTAQWRTGRGGRHIYAPSLAQLELALLAKGPRP